MKVFIVEESFPYEGGQPIAAFTTLEKASEYIRKTHSGSAGYFNIYEAQLDATDNMRFVKTGREEPT